ncbi:hypothetical protein [Endozoicomonas elysicola]|uniref:Uncharacterized protein n=1 Tax=Endozoicomonas elysicola TaxID=305900 RepID=A0A081KCU0_9GAMM|nr:hypothetical protein [Endozoicomonas elysicola]KEI71966.1 hypothetical protein GV64_15625 [Endozoicomonas elysicola]
MEAGHAPIREASRHSIGRQDADSVCQDSGIGRTQSFRDVRRLNLVHQQSFDTGSCNIFSAEAGDISVSNTDLERRAIAHKGRVSPHLQLYPSEGEGAFSSHEGTDPHYQLHPKTEQVGSDLQSALSELIEIRKNINTLKQSNIHAACLSSDILDLCNRLREAQQDKKSSDLVAGLSDQLRTKSRELLNVVKYAMEESGQTELPSYDLVSATCDGLNGGTERHEASDENFCWEQFCGNKGKLFGHSLGGGMFILGMVCIAIGYNCLASNGDSSAVKDLVSGFPFSAGNDTVQTTVAPVSNESGKCYPITYFGWGAVGLGLFIIGCGLFFNPPRICRSYCKNVRQMICHRSGAGRSSADPEASRTQVEYHHPGGNGASSEGGGSVRIQNRPASRAPGNRSYMDPNAISESSARQTRV